MQITTDFCTSHSHSICIYPSTKAILPVAKPGYSLLYLRDFMEAIDSEDVLTIQALRKHRNELAHDLPNMLHKLHIEKHLPLLEKTNKALFKLSNYRTYIEIGSDPAFQNKGINWDTIKGPEYELFEEVLDKVKILQSNRK